jgi:hypothetical protein
MNTTQFEERSIGETVTATVNPASPSAAYGATGHTTSGSQTAAAAGGHLLEQSEGDMTPSARVFGIT